MYYDKFIQPDFVSQHVPKVFEEICRQYLVRQNRKGLLPDSFERVGKYYYDDPVQKRNGEFDIVTESDGKYDFYEVKFHNEPMDMAVIRGEMKQVDACGLECRKYGFFSKSGFGTIDEKLRGRLILYTLADVYSGVF